MKRYIFPIKSIFMIFMHIAILSKCGSTNSMLLYFDRVVGKGGDLRSEELDL